MRLLNKVILALAVVLAIGVGVAVAAAITSTSSAGTRTTDGATPIGGTSSTLEDSTAPAQTGTGDVSGPCDEAEHANDPQCSGAQTTEDNDDVAGVDMSGPCDEAEHADDPRCTGAQTRGDDDENNSGSSENSGPGNADESRPGAEAGHVHRHIACPTGPVFCGLDAHHRHRSLGGNA